jgi:hypothetical protein
VGERGVTATSLRKHDLGSGTGEAGAVTDLACHERANADAVPQGKDTRTLRLGTVGSGRKGCARAQDHEPNFPAHTPTHIERQRAKKKKQQKQSIHVTWHVMA